LVAKGYVKDTSTFFNQNEVQRGASRRRVPFSINTHIRIPRWPSRAILAILPSRDDEDKKGGADELELARTRNTHCDRLPKPLHDERLPPT
jgi:hypothetical protein